MVKTWIFPVTYLTVIFRLQNTAAVTESKLIDNTVHGGWDAVKYGIAELRNNRIVTTKPKP